MNKSWFTVSHGGCTAMSWCQLIAQIYVSGHDQSFNPKPKKSFNKQSTHYITFNNENITCILMIVDISPECIILIYFRSK